MLYDEWNFTEPTVEALKKEFPVAEILAKWDHWLVVDLDKNSPYGDYVQRLQKYCDLAYYYGDNYGELQQLKFKRLPEDKIAEANKPENRNAVFIKQANEEWTKKYNEKRYSE